MNRITRLLAMAGMGLGAAVALAGPAQASTGDTSHHTTAVAKAGWGSEIVEYYSNPVSCNRAGRLGEIRGDWDDYDCYRVGIRGWALSVSDRGDWDGGGWHGSHGWHDFHGFHGFPGG